MKEFGIVLAVTGMVLAFIPTAAAAPPQTFACQISAPAQTQCTTGTHQHNGTIGLGFGGTFVGRASNILQWSTGSVVATCVFVGINIQPACTVQGNTPPPLATDFTHTCETDTQFAIPPTGTLSCSVTVN